MCFYDILEALRYLQLVSWQVLRHFHLNGIYSLPPPYLNWIWDVSQFLQIYLILSKAKSGFMQIKVPVTKEKNIFKPSLEHWRTIPVEKSWEVLK